MASERDKKIKGDQSRKEKSSGGISIRRFVITYFVLMSVFFLLTWFKPLYAIIDLNGLYTQSVVIVTSKVVGLLGIPCAYHGSVILLPDLSLDVKFGCNGLEAVMMYATAVLAYPAQWKKKIIGITAGFIVLQTTNIMRIVLLVYAGIHMRGLFEYMHIYVAQGIMIVLALGVFFIYLNYAKAIKEIHS